MTFKEAIKKYLDVYASSDECFKEKYDSNKIDGCCSYIIDEVKKIKDEKEQCVAMTDDEVYKMARHYFDEKIWENTKSDVKVVEDKKPVKKEKKVNDGQLNMFDFLGE